MIVPVQLLKSLLVHREKCTVKMPLIRQQWCAVLSGLRDAKKLKELVMYMLDKVCLVTMRATDSKHIVKFKLESSGACFHIRALNSPFLTNMIFVSFPLMKWRKWLLQVNSL